jgi:hypothetical protein
VPPAEGRDLPGYWGDARPASLAVAHLVRNSTRTAFPAQAVSARKTRRGSFTQSISNELSLDVVRAMAIAATMTAAVLALVSMFKG